MQILGADAMYIRHVYTKILGADAMYIRHVYTQIVGADADGKHGSVAWFYHIVDCKNASRGTRRLMFQLEMPTEKEDEEEEEEEEELFCDQNHAGNRGCAADC